MSLMSLTAVELGKKIKAKEVTVTEAVTAALDAIEAKEKRVNSFVTVDREGALKRAEEVQKMIEMFSHKQIIHPGTGEKCFIVIPVFWEIFDF